jgi:hypothetical protein
VIYCRVCGAPNFDADRVCQVCEATLGRRAAAGGPAGGRAAAAPAGQFGTDEKIRIFVGNVCLSPLLGTILYFVWKRDRPERAQPVCVLTWWATGVWVLLVTLFLIALAAEQ